MLHCKCPLLTQSDIGLEHQSLKNLGVFHADVLWFCFRPILYNPYCDVRAYRAFKSSFVVIWLIRLNAGEPHL